MGYTDILGWTAEQSANEQFTKDLDAPYNITIEYLTKPISTLLETVSFGFYNPSVVVKITAYDLVSGVKSFDWKYNKSSDASVINHPEFLSNTINAVQDSSDKSKFTAEFTLSAEELRQYRGFITVSAVDGYNNVSESISDSDNVIVVDTISPNISIEYSAPNNFADKSEGIYYHKDIEGKIFVTEANFFKEEVKVSISKDGGEAYSIDDKITWGETDSDDVTIGTFIIPILNDHSTDGDYVISINYTDKSGNEMTVEGEKKQYISDTYTVDTTVPVVSIEYKNTDVVGTYKDDTNGERKYYSDTQIAEIKVIEHNFDEELVQFITTAEDISGKDLMSGFTFVPEWKHNGDEHIAVIKYPYDANYSLKVKCTDLAGHKAVETQTDYFTVDKTNAEKLSVEYNESVFETVLESLTLGYYNSNVTVTFSAEDPVSGVSAFKYSYKKAPGASDINKDILDQIVTSDQIVYSENGKKATVSIKIPKDELNNLDQYNGYIEFSVVDRAGNETERYADRKQIIVDTIAPILQVNYNKAVNTVDDTLFYDGDIKVTVTVNEANFYKDDVKISLTKNGKETEVVDAKWMDTSVDLHVGEFTISGDGEYTFTVEYTDKSQNAMDTYVSPKMTIDTEIKTPTISINGVEKTNKAGAYKGDANVEFSFEDALISPALTQRFTVSEYIEHFKHYDQMKYMEISENIGIQKVAFLLL